MGRGAVVAEAAQSMFWFGLFMTASVGMVIFNKLVMQSYDYSTFLLIIQNTITIVLNLVGTKAGIFTMNEWKLEHFKIWALPTVTFSIMLVTSLKALPLVAVATTVVFRNMGTVLVACGDALLFSKEFNRDMKIAIGVILAGSIVYSYFDMNFNALGYLWMVANTSIFTCNVLYEKYAVTSVDQTAVGISCYQNVLSLPILTVALMTSGEQGAIDAWFFLPGYMQVIILLSGVFGCLLSVCYMSLNKFASPTAITIASNLNKLMSAIIGGLVFESKVTPHTVAGLLICMAGGYMYSSASSQGPKDKEPVQASDEEEPLTTAISEMILAAGTDDEDKKN